MCLWVKNDHQSAYHWSSCKIATLGLRAFKMKPRDKFNNTQLVNLYSNNEIKL